MIRRFSILFALALPLLLAPQTSAVASLQVAPLKYQATLHAGAPQTGIVTVANPTDTVLTVQSQVQAIRQIGTHGELQYYDDPQLSTGVIVPTQPITLQPHQSINVQFQLNPDALPQRGIYGVIFFRTMPPKAGAGNRIVQSVRVGTLLLLDNGHAAAAHGRIVSFTLPSLIYGSSILGSTAYRNTGSTAFNPRLHAQVGGGTAPQVVDGPYILPGGQRSFPVRLHGSRLGPLKIRLSDTTSGQVSTAVVWVVTGIWVWLFPLCVIGLAIAVAGLAWQRRKRRFIHFRTK